MAVTSILNNVSALGASYELGITGTGMQKTIQRLTTGKRINQASDDASGLVIANGLTADTQIDTQAQANANNLLTTLQTTDGTLNEATNLLTRAAELAQEAQGSNLSAQSTSALNAEYTSITNTFNNLVGTLTGGTTGLGGASGFGSFSVTISAVTQLTGDLSNATDAATAASAITTSLNSLGTSRGQIGAGEESLQAYSNVLGIEQQNKTSQLSQIQDANVADEVVNLTKWQILNQSGISALGKSNQAGQSILSLLQ
ncbi:MAG: flagellin [Holophaga sp.]|nr:flagellin [Holophaga sp.]